MRIRVHIDADDLRDKGAPFLADLARTLPKDCRVTVIVNPDAEATQPQPVPVALVDVADLPKSHRAAFHAIANGTTQPKDLQTELGLKPRRVQELLTDLLREQLIAKSETFGHYKVA